jgi:3-oxoadipate enol-lactonase
MPFAQIDDVHLHYRTAGDPANPCVVFSNSLGTDLRMWDAQAVALANRFYVVRYDTRGHGQSARGSAPVTIARLGQDVAGLLDLLGIRRAHFCGISMGGLTGQWLGAHAPERVDRLVLANTAARIGTAEGWAARAGLVRGKGMGAVADGAAARWFTPAFIERERHTVSQMIGSLREQDAAGYAACCDALAGADLRGALGSIAAPTLSIAGEFDPVTTLADGEALAAGIPGAQLALVPASHISNIEAEQAFTGALLRFLAA